MNANRAELKDKPVFPALGKEHISTPTQTQTKVTQVKKGKKEKKGVDMEAKINAETVQKHVVVPGLDFSLRLPDGSALKKRVPEEDISELTLQQAISQLLVSADSHKDWTSIEIKFPPPRRIITKTSLELEKSLHEISGGKDISLSIIDEATEVRKGDKIIIKKNKNKKFGTHTLLSTGITKKKKYEENFGGDSTVTTAGEEDDEEDDEEVSGRTNGGL